MIKDILKFFKILFYLLVVGLTGCANDATSAKVKSKESVPTKISNPDIFQHPVFDGLSKICLPYTDAISKDTKFDSNKLAIDNMAKDAGFSRGGNMGATYYPFPTYQYSIGNKDYGAEVVGGRTPQRSCSSYSARMSEYPMIPELTQWLNRHDQEWDLIKDTSYESDDGNFSQIFALYCKGKHTEFEQSLTYSVSIFEDEIKGKPRYRRSLDVTIKPADQTKCSDHPLNK